MPYRQEGYVSAGCLLSLEVAGDVADPEDQRALANELVATLRGLGLDGLTVDNGGVANAMAWAEDDASRDAGQLTMIVVALTSPALLTTVAQVISKWVDTQRCTLRMKIEDDFVEYDGRASGRTRKKLEDSLERFLDRHPPAPTDQLDER
jgi:hypothetical protein